MSGAIEMLNPANEEPGSLRIDRRQARGLKQQREPEPRKTHWAPGPLEYQAEQEEKTKAQIEADAGEGATRS
jgi:hypothetical protein